ncbi:ABC transporter substrate-binding protein [Longispora fulva]|uniref:Raffinose/stachyose/melibiose transport system substrate-binding protein n=1 Tax=Longispora fulva TaxID=619741 RepID=A0A8J7KI45_9ACTN|nr:extracellular solute-binding protein [Longispora fulva]MBG6135814.1 raffinose/stachyose/melibiose transport system substrate-binding protein [Longispora fulva]GIG55942.1 ABC transporter substrate-binding protein [Longispora fulva]
MRHQHSRRDFAARSGAVTAAAATAAVVFALTGCGTKVGDTSPVSSNVPLTVWSNWPQGTPQDVVYQKIAADFTAATGIKVKLTAPSKDNTAALLNAAATGGDSPDVFVTAAGPLARLRAGGALADPAPALAQTVPGTGKTLAQLIPQVYLTASSDKTGVGMVPEIVDGNGVWFDAARTPELAANPPATFDQLLRAAAGYKAEGKVAFAQEGAQSRYNMWWFFMLQLRQNGAGSFAGLSQSAAAWDSPGVLTAAKQVEQLARGGYFQPGFEGSVYPNAQNQWRSGKMVMELNGSWLASETKPVAPAGSKPEVFAFPAVAGAAHNSLQYQSTIGYAIDAKSAHQDWAARYIAFAMQPRYQEMMATQTINIPALNGVLAPPELRALQQIEMTATEIAQNWDNAPSVAPKWWTDVLPPLDDKLIKGQLTAEQFVAAAKQDTAAYLAGGVK